MEELDRKKAIRKSEAELELSEAEVKRLKREYGSDWKRVVGGAVKGVVRAGGKVRVNQEALHTLYASGAGLKDYNNPKSWRR